MAQAPVGLISDTHGLLRPEALDVLASCELVLHAGDVGAEDVLVRLAERARVVAVRGNVDRGPWARDLPPTEVVDVGAGRLVYLLHDLGALGVDPAVAGFAAVVSGHSHVPKVERRGAVLMVNPGSAGPRRFRLPASLALLHVAAGGLEAELITLEG